MSLWCPSEKSNLFKMETNCKDSDSVGVLLSCDFEKTADESCKAADGPREILPAYDAANDTKDVSKQRDGKMTNDLIVDKTVVDIPAELTSSVENISDRLLPERGWIDDAKGVEYVRTSGLKLISRTSLTNSRTDVTNSGKLINTKSLTNTEKSREDFSCVMLNKSKVDNPGELCLLDFKRDSEPQQNSFSAESEANIVTFKDCLSAAADTDSSVNAKLHFDSSCKYRYAADLIGDSSCRDIDAADLIGDSSCRYNDAADLIGDSSCRDDDAADLIGGSSCRDNDAADLIGDSSCRDHDAAADLIGDSLSVLNKGAEQPDELRNECSASADLLEFSETSKSSQASLVHNMNEKNDEIDADQEPCVKIDLLQQDFLLEVSKTEGGKLVGENVIDLEKNSATIHKKSDLTIQENHADILESIFSSNTVDADAEQEIAVNTKKKKVPTATLR